MSDRITIIGSSNVDFIMKVAALPAPGETVTGGEFMVAFGGKGANQAVAATRAGGDVGFVSCLGDDVYAPRLLEPWTDDGMETAAVEMLPGESCGSALIMIDARGENCIAVAPGANDRLTPDRVRDNEDRIAASAVLLMQMEIPPESVREAIALGAKHGTPVLLNYAPVRDCPVPLDCGLTGLVVNEIEAGALLGRQAPSPAQAGEAARALRARGPELVIVTLGAKGALLCDASGETRVPAFPIEAADTTGAGDTFCGAFAVGLVEGMPRPDAVRFAGAAAALAASRVGAQPSIPTRAEIDRFLADRSA